jgi:hypothetical protein
MKYFTSLVTITEKDIHIERRLLDELDRVTKQTSHSHWEIVFDAQGAKVNAICPDGSTIGVSDATPQRAIEEMIKMMMVYNLYHGETE